MIECIEEFSTKLEANVFVEDNSFRERNIEIRLPRSIHDSRAAVPEICSKPVRSDDRWICKAGSVEVTIQLRLHRSTRHQLTLRTSPAELRPVFTDTKDVLGICIGNRQSAARLDGDNARYTPRSQHRARDPAMWAGKVPRLAKYESMSSVETGPPPTLPGRILIPQCQ